MHPYIGTILLIVTLAIQLSLHVLCAYLVVLAWDTYRGLPKGFPIFTTGIALLSVIVVNVLYIPVFANIMHMIRG
jgi:hypothetical protein